MQGPEDTGSNAPRAEVAVEQSASTTSHLPGQENDLLDLGVFGSNRNTDCDAPQNGNALVESSPTLAPTLIPGESFMTAHEEAEEPATEAEPSRDNKESSADFFSDVQASALPIASEAETTQDVIPQSAQNIEGNEDEPDDFGCFSTLNGVSDELQNVVSDPSPPERLSTGEGSQVLDAMATKQVAKEKKLVDSMTGEFSDQDEAGLVRTESDEEADSGLGKKSQTLPVDPAHFAEEFGGFSTVEGGNLENRNAIAEEFQRVDNMDAQLVEGMATKQETGREEQKTDALTNNGNDDANAFGHFLSVEAINIKGGDAENDDGSPKRQMHKDTDGMVCAEADSREQTTHTFSSEVAEDVDGFGDFVGMKHVGDDSPSTKLQHEGLDDQTVRDVATEQRTHTENIATQAMESFDAFSGVQDISEKADPGEYHQHDLSSAMEHGSEQFASTGTSNIGLETGTSLSQDIAGCEPVGVEKSLEKQPEGAKERQHTVSDPDEFDTRGLESFASGSHTQTHQNREGTLERALTNEGEVLTQPHDETAQFTVAAGVLSADADADMANDVHSGSLDGMPTASSPAPQKSIHDSNDATSIVKTEEVGQTEEVHLVEGEREFGSFDNAKERLPGSPNEEDPESANDIRPSTIGSQDDDEDEFGDFEGPNSVSEQELGSTSVPSSSEQPPQAEQTSGMADDDEDFGDFSEFSEAHDTPTEADGEGDSPRAIPADISTQSCPGAINPILVRANDVFNDIFSHNLDDTMIDEMPERKLVPVKTILTPLRETTCTNSASNSATRALCALFEEVGNKISTEPKMVIHEESVDPYGHLSTLMSVILRDDTQLDTSNERRPVSVSHFSSDVVPIQAGTKTQQEYPAAAPAPASNSASFGTVVALPESSSGISQKDGFTIENDEFANFSQSDSTTLSTEREEKPLSETARQFLQQIPDLSFMLKSTLSLPKKS